MNKLLFFSTNTCRTCKMMYPILEELRSKRIPIIENTFTHSSNQFPRYKVNATPTIILVDGDENELDRLVGFHTLGQIEDLYLKNKKE